MIPLKKRLIGAAIALVVPLTAAVAIPQASGSSVSEDDWERLVVAPSSSVKVSAGQEQLSIFEDASAMLDDHMEIWGKNHFDPDGTVVVNVTAGWERVVGEDLNELVTNASAPIRIREVDHSSQELMREVLDPRLPKMDFAGASVVGATVDPEENRLIISLTEVDEDSVNAARVVFGDDVRFRQGQRFEPTLGPDRWKDRYPYSGGAGYAPLNFPYSEASCTSGFAMRRVSNNVQYMLTAGHCIGTSGPASYNAAYSLVGDGSVWANLLGSASGATNTLNSSGASWAINGHYYGDLTVWPIDAGDPTIFWGGRRATAYSTIKSFNTDFPSTTETNLCLSGANGGNNCGWDVVDVDVSATIGGAWVYPLVHVADSSGPCVFIGDSGGPWIKGVSGGSRAVGIQSGATRPNQPTGPCEAVFTSIHTAYGLWGIVPLTG
ncbi:chymotrypsin family serine protease [Jiangella endophytica]|uniref:hypothetical protein n=1 Tax=Jiangella endophytica TaxID=1623398 RepID=UPI0013003130|nr:hypothetical protein [Jiangella endophytica]